MSSSKKIKSALISVFYKDGLEPIVKKLNELGVTIYSTGGTQTFIESFGINVEKVEDLTSYPSILGGRVKTLHPKIFGGILARREHIEDTKHLQEYNIPELDLVIVDLYPFEETVKSDASEADIIEKIDIGGVSLIRAAAKNFKDVIIVASKEDYAPLLDILNSNNGGSTISDRYLFAQKAFNITSHYDSLIFDYFNQKSPLSVFKQSVQQSSVLRYGENPHQNAVFYGNLDDIFEKHNGKELSYNNLVDVDAAMELIDEFETSAPTFAIIKHTNACGIATRATVLDAWKDSLACDPVSAFGGIIACNKRIDQATAEEINKLFFEVLIAPGYDSDALATLCQKKNRIILTRKAKSGKTRQFKSLLNGVIEQSKDLKTESAKDMTPITQKKPSDQELSDLSFAAKVVKHTKSNTIVLAKNDQLLASGVGQTSRVDALQQAILKAKTFGFDIKGAAMASDAFFPFPDCVEIAADAGISAILQPGGSINDQLSVDMANQKGVSMVTTGVRHFKH